MADNITLDAGSGGAVMATDDIGGVHYQLIKLGYGALDAFTIVTASAGLPVAQQGTWTVTGAGGTFPVTGTFWQATQPVSIAATVTVTGAGGTFPVTDNSGSLTVDAPVGTPVFVRLSDGSSAITTLPVSMAAVPTGASTAAKQPALGTAGTASADVITVQGIASMTALKVDGSAVTQPVSGTFWQTNQAVIGAEAHDAAATTAPVLLAGYGSTATPSATSADGDVTRLWTTRRGGVNVTLRDSANAIIDTQPIGVDAASFGGIANTSTGFTVVSATRIYDTGTGEWQAVCAATPMPVGGTVAVSAVTSLTQFNGTTIATNSGNKDAGTLRVVLATDQPALTNKLLTTPDLPSGASTAAKQPALGTAGTASADVITIQGISSMTPILTTLSGTNNIATVTTVTTCSTLTTLANGQTAHDSAVSGSPLRIGAKAETALSGITLVADGDATDLHAGVDGVLITRPHCNLEDVVQERTTNTDGASTAFASGLAAPGAGVRLWIKNVTICNSSSSFCTVDLRDGSGGSVLWTLPVPATGGVTHNFDPPLRLSANTALAFDASAATTTLSISANGFKSKV